MEVLKAHPNVAPFGCVALLEPPSNTLARTSYITRPGAAAITVAELTMLVVLVGVIYKGRLPQKLVA